MQVCFLNGFTDGSSTTSIINQSSDFLALTRKSLLCRKAAAPIPIPGTGISLHISVPPHTYFALIQGKPIFLMHSALCGHVHCSLFIRSVKENVCS